MQEIRPAAVIAEYNPFHSGHAYHIEKTRSLYGATHIVAVMSGNFVQRGECACVSKWARTKMALCGGADLVVELPLPWACATAERFAYGAVSLVNALGGMEMLSFGSECGDTEKLKAAAGAVDSPELSILLKEKLSSGMSFAAARSHALTELYGDLSLAVSSPNDTLGVEYIRALERTGSDIEPVCVTRRGAGHDQTEPAPENASGAYIRARLNAGKQPEYIPPDCMKYLVRETRSGRAPASLAFIERAVLMRLRSMSLADISALPDISEGLEHRLYKAFRESTSLEGVYSAVKTKRYSHARIRRLVLSALLGINRSDCEGAPPYIRLLGMNAAGRELLGKLSPTLPVVTRRADFDRLGSRENRIFELEQQAADIFALCTPTVGGCGSDVKNGIVIL